MKKAFLQLHIAVFLAGFTAILGKLIGLNEGLLVWYRLFFSIVVLSIFLAIKNSHQRIARSDFFNIACVGLILAFHWVAFYGSVKYANASVAVVCISAAGFFSAILEPILMKKKIVMVELLLGLIAMAGIYIIFDFHPQYKVGIIFGLIAAIGSAVFPIYNKKLLNRFKPELLTLYEFIGGLLFLSLLLPIYFLKFPPAYYWPTATDYLWLLILTLLCTVIAFLFQLNALRRISAFTSNLTYNLEPLYGIILAFLIFKEGNLLNTHFYYGLSLIMLSISLQMIRVYHHSKIKEK